ncbi:MAG: DJ-1 family protein [Firmicutes bacterium HGW-Firmicutes-16]|nr:MAG: DJ-1 family protein [Firmicutes bacterium HGW-Firmicutes-16]
MVYIILGEGFEEIEAVVPCDILRRGGASVRLAAIGNSKTVAGGRGISVLADVLTADIAPTKDDIFVIPGGSGGVNSIIADTKTMTLLETASNSGAFFAAICAGPSVLAKLGLIDGKRITCYPGCESLMGKALCDTKKPITTDEGLITGRSAGSAIDFALALLSHLKGEKIAEKVSADLVY